MSEGLSLNDRLELIAEVIGRQSDGGPSVVERFDLISDGPTDEYVELELSGFTDAPDSVLLELLEFFVKDRPQITDQLRRELRTRARRYIQGDDESSAIYRRSHLISAAEIAEKLGDDRMLEAIEQATPPWAAELYLQVRGKRGRSVDVQEFAERVRACLSRYCDESASGVVDSDLGWLASHLSTQTQDSTPELREAFAALVYESIESVLRHVFNYAALNYLLELGRTKTFRVAVQKAFHALTYDATDTRKWWDLSEELFARLHEEQPLPFEAQSAIAKNRRQLLRLVVDQKGSIRQVFVHESTTQLELAELLPLSDAIHADPRFGVMPNSMEHIRQLAELLVWIQDPQLGPVRQLVSLFESIHFPGPRQYPELLRAYPLEHRLGIYRDLLETEHRLNKDRYLSWRRYLVENGIGAGKFILENLMKLHNPASLMFSDSIQQRPNWSPTLTCSMRFDGGFGPGLGEKIILDDLAQSDDRELIELYRRNLVGIHNREDLWKSVCSYNPGFASAGRPSSRRLRQQALSINRAYMSSEWRHLKEHLSTQELLDLASKLANGQDVESVRLVFEEACEREDAESTGVKAAALEWADGLLQPENLFQPIRDALAYTIAKPDYHPSRSHQHALLLYHRLEPKGALKKIEFVIERLTSEIAHARETPGFPASYAGQLETLLNELVDLWIYDEMKVPIRFKRDFAKRHGRFVARSLLARLLENDRDPASRLFVARWMIEEGKFSEAKRIFDDLGMAEEWQAKTRAERLSMVRRNLEERPGQGFAALQELIAADDLAVRCSTLERNFTGGFFTDFVSRIDYTGLFELSLVVKFQLDTPAARRVVDLEERIFEGLRRYLPVPTRLKTGGGETSSGRQYVITIDEVLPGEDLDELEELTEALVRKAVEDIAAIQTFLKGILTDEDLDSVRDPFDDGQLFDYGGKIVDSLKSAFGVTVPIEPFEQINSTLNDPENLSHKAITFDANPSNIKHISGDRLGFFDFNVVRSAYPQEDWARFVDHPDFLPEELRDRVLQLFLDRDALGSVIRPNPDVEWLLFHNLAVYRNLCLTAQRTRGSRDLAAHYLNRARMSAEVLSLGKTVELIDDLRSGLDAHA